MWPPAKRFRGNRICDPRVEIIFFAIAVKHARHSWLGHSHRSHVLMAEEYITIYLEQQFTTTHSQSILKLSYLNYLIVNDIYLRLSDTETLRFDNLNLRQSPSGNLTWPADTTLSQQYHSYQINFTNFLDSFCWKKF